MVGRPCASEIICSLRSLPACHATVPWGVTFIQKAMGHCCEHKAVSCPERVGREEGACYFVLRSGPEVAHITITYVSDHQRS